MTGYSNMLGNTELKLIPVFSSGALATKTRGAIVFCHLFCFFFCGKKEKDIEKKLVKCLPGLLRNTEQA